MERNTIIKLLATSKNLQFFVNEAMEKFRAPIWPMFFNYKEQINVNFTTIKGASSLAAAASVVTYNSAAPLRARKSLGALTGDIPSIREKFRMDENDLRTVLSIQSNINGDAMAKQVLGIVYDDIKNTAEAPHRRLDYMALEAISTGQITLSTTNNPDGVVTVSNVDFGIPGGQKLHAATAAWSTAASCVPIDDINRVIALAEAAGLPKPKSVMMNRTNYNYFRGSAQVQKYIAGSKGQSSANVAYNLNLDYVNSWLEGEGLPKIVISDITIPIEKNGIVTSVNPFSSENIVFLPYDFSGSAPDKGSLGTMFAATPIEKLNPSNTVTYATVNNVLIKRWNENDPFAEYTACEMNAFPAYAAAPMTYLMDVLHTS